MRMNCNGSSRSGFDLAWAVVPHSLTTDAGSAEWLHDRQSRRYLGAKRRPACLRKSERSWRPLVGDTDVGEHQTRDGMHSVE